MERKVAVVGSRTFNDYELLEKTLTDYLFINTSNEEFYYNCYNTIIVSGGARGADKLAERFAEEKGLDTEIHLPNWDLYGKSAGFIRNRKIIENSHIVFAFWDGKSKGTKHSIDLAKTMNKEIHIIRYTNEA